MVLHRLTHFVETNNLLSSSQHGFRRGRSTLEALAELGDTIASAFESRDTVAAVFFDFARAFDTVLPSHILHLLSSIGIHGPLLLYLQSFLSPRPFQVRIGHVTSPTFLAHRGTPQGSVLSPLLFILAIDGVTKLAPPALHISLYADDLAIYVPVKHPNQAQPLIQDFITRTVEWSQTSGLHLTPSKCTSLIFFRYRSAPPPLSLFIGATPIPTATTVRFLGLIWDRALNWSAHINYLRSSCSRRLNILAMTAGTRWGADRTCLLRFYRAYVRSLLDYGSPIYGSANPGVLTRLDPIHHKGLRVALGAFASSPTISLLAETPEPPLKLRRSLLTVQFYYRALSLPHNQTKNFLVPHPHHNAFLLRESLPRPLSVRAQIIISDFSLPDCCPLSLPPLPVPHWSLSQPTINLQLSVLPKATTPPVQYRQAFLHLCSKYQGAAIFFSDGAKSEDGVGVGIYHDQRAVAFPMPPYTSIFTAEATGIERALLWAARVSNPTIIIASDSLSVLKALQSPQPQHATIFAILLNIHNLQLHMAKRVVLMWCPGHSGIFGNEQADKAATSGARAPPPLNMISLHQDLKTHSNRVLDEHFKEWWVLQDPATNKLRSVKTSPTPWTSACRPQRREEVTLCRLRIGHTKLTHGHLMERAPPPICCGVQLTVRHILTECRQHQDNRLQYLPSQNLKKILSNDEHSVTNLFTYLNLVHLYDQL
jgi:ribonuclease HI